jgi:predicted secreted Zn-dependent protease
MQGLVPYKQLTWQDFPINDRVNGLDAKTNGTITYDFKTRWELENNTYTAYVTQITFRSWFDTKQSWRRSRLPQDSIALLRHEQLHLDIMQIGALALMALKSEAIASSMGASQIEAEASLATSVKRLVEGVLEKIKYRQSQYDLETRHGRDKRMQAQWDSKITRELANAKNTQNVVK